ncbi:MAG: cytochrome P450 [Myxococcota bacterium]
MSDRDEFNRAVSEARNFNPYTQDFLEREFEIYRRLRENVPIARSEVMASPTLGEVEGGWVLTRYDDGCEVLTNAGDFSSQVQDYPVRPWIPQAIDPPMHTSYRRILNPWFAPKEMAKLEPHLYSYAERLVDEMLENDRFDFVGEYADPFPTVIFCELAGFPAEDYPQIMDWKNTIMHADDGHERARRTVIDKARAMGLEVGPEDFLSPESVGAVVGGAAGEVYQYFQGLLEARRAEPRDDLVSKLLAAQYEGERALTQEELEDTLFLLFMAGLDTVASALGLMVRDLATNAAKRAELISILDSGDSKKIGQAIEELVRVHSIVLLPRRVTREHSFHGALFQGEDQVLVPTQATNRDPEEFPNPDALDFERFPNRHVGFGLGPHRCLGIHLARRELRVALEVFLKKCPDFELDPEREANSFAGMKGLATLPLIKR